MPNKLETTCSMQKSCCPCGWLGKNLFGLSLAVWLIVFAILPHSARGVMWTANTVSGLWERDRSVSVSPRDRVNEARKKRLDSRKEESK